MLKVTPLVGDRARTQPGQHPGTCPPPTPHSTGKSLSFYGLSPDPRPSSDELPAGKVQISGSGRSAIQHHRMASPVLWLTDRCISYGLRDGSSLYAHSGGAQWEGADTAQGTLPHCPEGTTHLHAIAWCGGVPQGARHVGHAVCESAVLLDSGLRVARMAKGCVRLGPLRVHSENAGHLHPDPGRTHASVVFAVSPLPSVPTTILSPRGP